MTSSQLLHEGVELMLMGMGSVFFFLALLILCIRLMARVIERFVPAPHAREANAPVSAKLVGHEPGPDVLAAIQLALHQHRARRG
ncbi:OadG family protein [Pseudomonas paeninsulae]|uniref:OadG family protein n=1 Tax=Pseudomonas paeninsulae TaxID=3110772 RepID=UPI002D784EAB|nr:OadG family protein [Pseudomonas sp. IT1137]